MNSTEFYQIPVGLCVRFLKLDTVRIEELLSTAEASIEESFRTGYAVGIDIWPDSYPFDPAHVAAICRHILFLRERQAVAS